MRGHEHATASTLRHSPPIRAVFASSQASRAAGASARSWADAPPVGACKCRRGAAMGVGTPPHGMCIRNRAPPFYFSPPSKQVTADNIAIADIALNPGILLSYHKLWSVGSDRIAAFHIKTQFIYFIHFSGLSITQYAEVLPLLLNLILVALCAPLPFITSVSYFRA